MTRLAIPDNHGRGHQTRLWDRFMFEAENLPQYARDFVKSPYTRLKRLALELSIRRNLMVRVLLARRTRRPSLD
jgi:hypothetical protein